MRPAVQMSAELRGTKCYVAWGVAERGPLFRLCSATTTSYRTGYHQVQFNLAYVF
jgi:hypothetical protein